jgi:hypothetical protein
MAPTLAHRENPSKENPFAFYARLDRHAATNRWTAAQSLVISSSAALGRDEHSTLRKERSEARTAESEAMRRISLGKSFARNAWPCLGSFGLWLCYVLQDKWRRAQS